VSESGDDPDGAIVHVEWDFGDGTRALSASGSRTAALPGNYVATVWTANVPLAPA
jgi:chitodextrinase